MSEDFKGRTAWVVGASGALGEAIARALADRGATVVLSGRRADALDTVAASLPVGLGLARTADASSDDSVRDTAAGILAELGRIDFLVNSTTVPTFGEFQELTDADWLRVINAKQLAYVRTQRAVLPHMVERRFGRIVNISGRGGRHPSRVHLPGGAANAAVEHLTKGLAKIHASHNIRVNAVSPGPIRSPRMAAMRNAGVPGAAGPVLGTGLPEDVAAAVLFLLSEQARFITGTVLKVEGGGPPLG